MIINTITVILTLFVISIFGYVGLKMIRQFAFSIALENHESNQALDNQEEVARQKRIDAADAAAAAAFAKVQPLLPSAKALSSKTNSNDRSGATSPNILQSATGSSESPLKGTGEDAA